MFTSHVILQINNFNNFVMDFARKQLEKYGWSDGKGLGKNENGISEALKPKLKRSVTGIGHDPAAEFNEHWWTALYDKAAKNVEVEEKNGKTKKIKTNSKDLVISSSTWKINKKHKTTDESEYSEYFVRTTVLTNDKGGRKTENVRSDSGKEDNEDNDVKKDVFKMTDEELFAACEGRTAHKGARHGLRATGKLARIAEQELKLLTQPQYQGYSHAKKLKEEAEQMTTQVQNVPEVQKKKKKGKKYKDLQVEDVLAEGNNEVDGDINRVDIEKNRSIKEEAEQMTSEVQNVLEVQKKKKKGNKCKDLEVEDVLAEGSNEVDGDINRVDIEKNRSIKEEAEQMTSEVQNVPEVQKKKKKGNKCKDLVEDVLAEGSNEVDGDINRVDIEKNRSMRESENNLGESLCDEERVDSKTGKKKKRKKEKVAELSESDEKNSKKKRLETISTETNEVSKSKKKKDKIKD